MCDQKDHGSQKPSPDLRQAQNIFLSPTWNAIESITAQTPRKRKLNDVQHENDIGEAFAIKSPSSLPFPTAQKLIPKLLLPRSCLPLAYLDPLAGRDDLIGSKFFSSAHIEALEQIVHEERRSRQPTILIAHSTIDDGLFAIEHIREGIYALCRLRNWVTVDTLQRLQVVPIDITRPRKRQFPEQPRLEGDKWWSTATIDGRHAGRYDASNDVGFERTRAVQLCLQMPQQRSIKPAPMTQEISHAISQGQFENVMKDTMEDEAQDPGEILKMVQAQYQESLYTSKSSLAYFAKGPLSRARAVFNINNGSANDHSQLTSFLRSCILSLTIMDTKYRETLPDLIKGFPFDTLSDEECTVVVDTVSKKVRRSKRSNVGKNGLYPGEEANIARWWLSRDLSFVACDSADAREEATKLAILQQRNRETQMQIVLSLETLALESAAAIPAVEKLSPRKARDGEDDSQNKKTKKKAKKTQDLGMLLDLLVDRLCIWQSMSMDVTKTSNGEDNPTAQHGAKATAKGSDNDHLRQFCVDVVLPFYGSRLPELTTLLCKKLGGPNKPSPRRPALARSASSYASLKPGASLKRQQARKPRRTLERVLTDERSASQKPPPSLSRSITDPILPQVKREVSDTSLSSIPLNRVAMHKRYSQREVDLHATSQVAEAKLKKKARVEHELQDAIAALKKPNPRMAVKELVEDAERRSTASHSRKPKRPIRNPLAQGAQVMATPSNNRHKDVYGGLPRLPRPSTAVLSEVEEVPPSSISCVPSSSRKAQQISLLAPDSTKKTNKSALLTAETPTKGRSKLSGHLPTSTAAVGSIGHIIQPSPQPSPLSVASRHPEAPENLSRRLRWPLRVHETPSKFRYPYKAEQSGDGTIHTTPVKAPSAPDKFLEDQNKTDLSPLSPDKEESIYVALGWDDVDELL